MTDTSRTQPELLTLFGDLPVVQNRITPQMARDLIVSLGAVRNASVNVKDAPYNALGTNGDDTVALAAALLASASKLIVVPPGTYPTTAQGAVLTSTTIDGAGRSSILKTSTVSSHILTVATPGVLLRALSFLGVKGTTVLNNSAVAFSSATDALVQNVEASGMSGMAFYVTLSDHVRIFNSYVHGLTGDTGYIDSTDIGFYTSVSYCVAAFNRLLGGSKTESGVTMQLNSIKNLVIGNEIGAHWSYGILDYDTTPRSTNSIIALNRVEDIDGTGASTDFVKGAGIYFAGTGGQINALNQIRNTNINTTTESLAPGGIGVNGAFSPQLHLGNMIWNANWYGFIVVSSTTALVEIANQHIFESLKMGIKVKASSHVLISGGSITMLTTTPLTQRGIGINVDGGGPFTNVSVKGTHIRGSVRGIESISTNNVSLIGVQISEVNGIGIRITTGTGGVISDCNVDSTTSATDPALDISAMQNLTVKGNVFKSTFATCIRTAGTCTGSVFDSSNILVGMDMNNVDNAGTGMKFELFGTAAPTVKNHQVADRVVNSVPAAGSPKAWVCTVAGVPGTWVSEGNL